MKEISIVKIEQLTTNSGQSILNKKGSIYMAEGAPSGVGSVAEAPVNPVAPEGNKPGGGLSGPDSGVVNSALQGLEERVAEQRQQLEQEAESDAGSFGGPNIGGENKPPVNGGIDTQSTQPSGDTVNQKSDGSGVGIGSSEAPVVQGGGEGKDVGIDGSSNESIAGSSVDSRAQENQGGQPGEVTQGKQEESTTTDTTTKEGEGEKKAESSADGVKTPEDQVSPEKSLRIPKKVASNPEFKQIWGEMAYDQNLNGDINVDALNERALTEFYTRQAKKQMAEGIPQDVKDSSLFEQKLKEEAKAAAERGEDLNTNENTEKALVEYYKVKDIQEEEVPVVEDVAKEDKSAEGNEAVKELVEGLKSEIAQLKDENHAMKELMGNMLNFMQERDPKEKEALWKQILAYALALGIESFKTLGKEVVPTEK